LKNFGGSGIQGGRKIKGAKGKIKGVRVKIKGVRVNLIR
jgi:hypothetical protein